MNASYTCSGVLIGVPAIGRGDFYSTFGDILGTVRGTISSKQRDGQNFLQLDPEATNMFLRHNGHEVLRAIKPQLRLQLSEVFLEISNQLLSHVPIDMFLL
ncbi:hypothetical protein C0J52_04723 [Blattella germanica]|nr:hypothetical protein C0J52_04723 [Blattella germanica]